MGVSPGYSRREDGNRVGGNPPPAVTTSLLGGRNGGDLLEGRPAGTTHISSAGALAGLHDLARLGAPYGQEGLGCCLAQLVAGCPPEPGPGA
jgi:hypothetical protein